MIFKPLAALLAFGLVASISPQEDETSALIERLGHKDPAEREKAAARLLRLGEAADARIEQARNHPDRRIAALAKGIWLNRKARAGLGRVTDDPKLRKKLDELLRDHPGQGILIVRARELRDGAFRPVTEGFSMKIMLEDAKEEPDPLVEPGGPEADVDADGDLLFVTVPGHYRAVGYDQDPAGELKAPLKNLCFTWEYQPFVLEPDGVLKLADALFAPWTRWTAPAEGSQVSLIADPKIAWAPYPEIRHVRIDAEQVLDLPDGGTSWQSVNTLRIECPKDSALSLADVLKGGRLPIGRGDKLALRIIGYGRDGKELTQCRDKLLFTLKD